MDCNFLYTSTYLSLPTPSKYLKCRVSSLLLPHSLSISNTRINYKKQPKKLSYPPRRSKQPKNRPSHPPPRRTKQPPDFGVNLFLKKPTTDTHQNDKSDEEDGEKEEEGEEEDGSDVAWEPEEIEAISALFERRIPQKPGNLDRERPLPLPLPYKVRPLGLPTPKKHLKRPSIANQVYRNPRFLISLAKEIRCLDSDKDVSSVLDDYARYLRKGSLSLTIRELGHMGLPNRALQTFCWAQKQPHLFPDDRILASTVEVLARNRDLKLLSNLEKLTSLASRGVVEAMIRGLIRGGNFNVAMKVLGVARDGKRILDSSVYAKLILELGKYPDKVALVEALLNELAEQEVLNLSQQDCTAVMKVCTKLRKFEVVESLFNWFKESGHEPSVVMYTTLIHSRYCEKKYREALALLWEMEGSNCLFDLPAYHVVIKLFVALNDISRAARYFSKLKEAGFSPTYGIYKDLVTVYMVSGRLAKCKEIWKEANMAGFKFDRQITFDLLELQRETRLGF